MNLWPFKRAYTIQRRPGVARVTVQGSERGLGRAMMVATTAGETTNLSNAGGGAIRATAAREAARERMVREVASGRGRQGRQHRGGTSAQRHLLGWRRRRVRRSN